MVGFRGECVQILLGFTAVSVCLAVRSVGKCMGMVVLLGNATASTTKRGFNMSM